MLLVAILLLGSVNMLIFGWVWMDTDYSRAGLAARLGGAGAFGALFLGGIPLPWSLLGGVAYGLGYRGFITLADYWDDGFWWTWLGALGLALAPIFIPALVALPFQKRNHEQVFSLQDGHRRWREEFQRSGAVDPSTFEAADPRAVRPPGVDHDEPPAWRTTARAANASAVRRLRAEQARKRGTPGPGEDQRWTG